jgi:hypothetical protein
LHIGGEDRVRGRQDRPEEHRRTQREAEPEPAHEREAADGEHHRRCRQPEWESPPRVSKGQAQLQPGGEQGDNHRDFGDPLHHGGVAQGVYHEEPAPGRPEGGPHSEVEQGGGQREAAHQGACQRHENEQGADDEIP